MKKNDAIRELRKLKGLTQQQMANELGLAVSSVARYEAGKPPEARVLAQLSALSREVGKQNLAEIFETALRAELGITSILDFEKPAVQAFQLQAHVFLSLKLLRVTTGKSEADNAKIQEVIDRLQFLDMVLKEASGTEVKPE